MSDQSNRQNGQEHLPIRLVLPQQGTERRVQAAGSPPVPFRPVNQEYRTGLQKQVLSTKRALFGEQTAYRAAPIRVTLLTRSIAKSHRPESLFSEKTCPIIGSGQLGELFLKATPRGLDNLASVITTGNSNRLVKEISGVETVEPITPAFRRHGLTPRQILQESRRSNERFVARVRLFSFGGDDDERVLVAEFERYCGEKGITLDSDGYTPENRTYSALCRNEDDVNYLSRFVAVRSVVNMPIIRTGQHATSPEAPFKPAFNRGDVSGDIPVVVVVDSGISPEIPELEEWVAGRSSSVAPPYRNPQHGTFVAGLICWGSELNPSIRNIDPHPCGVFDLQVIPNSDPAKGDVDFLTEQEFLIALEGALRTHANTYKVWNLSLGSDAVCSIDDFSPFAEEIDNLQEKYRVSFVISAGNYEKPPLLDFPRTGNQRKVGRITTPADSVLAVTVGSIAHEDSPDYGPKRNDLAPYSRHGAGPNFVIKPDLVHYGGTCSTTGSNRIGVTSIGKRGTTKDMGTSFATPLVSKTLAQIYHQVTPTPSPVLARALLTHHARDPRTGWRVPDGDEDYFGFGLPEPVPYCLQCDASSSTLVFDDVLRPGYFLEWDDFPYPPSLKRNGRFFGEITMTVAFAPSRGSRWGSEYCETHIDAHFGVFRKHVSRKDGSPYIKFRGLVPPEHKNQGMLYESYQIAKLRKWAPVRTYHGDMGSKGEPGERWRLKVQLLTRHGADVQGRALRPQPFSLIITIADPSGRAPVYDEMARMIANRFQAESLALRAAPRVRASATQSQ